MCAKVTLEHKLEIRDRIVAGALISFSKNGFDKTRMDDIAAESGVSKGTIYIYFKSKEELFYELCEKNLVALREQLFSLLVINYEGNNAKNDILISNAKGFFNSFSQVENSYIIFLEILSKSTRNKKLKSILYSQHEKIVTSMREHILDSIKNEKTRNFPEEKEIDSMVMSLMTVYNGLMMNRLLGIKEETNKKTWDDSVSRIIGTMRK
jgi:TetR/AcrR family transcriptional regulator, repressor for uid operon